MGRGPGLAPTLIVGLGLGLDVALEVVRGLGLVLEMVLGLVLCGMRLGSGHRPLRGALLRNAHAWPVVAVH